MRTKLALAVALILSLLGAGKAAAQANAANYAFSTTVTGSLTDMSSGTATLVAADQDDTASAVTLLGFDFYFMGVRQDRFSVNSNGTLRFGAAQVGSTLYDPLAQAGQSLVTAYGADQRTHAGNGKVHFKVLGSAPNRVAVIEWLNMQSDFNSGGTVDLTYQVRLSETTGTIEFVYGSMSLSAAGAADPNSQSPQFGFSSNSAVGTVGSITAAQSGTPAPTFSGASAAPVNNLYVAGTIPVLTSAADGSRRTFLLAPAVVNPPGGPLTFTAVTATGMTLNWTDSSNETGYAIYISTDGTNFSFVNTAAQNATSFVASSLLGGTTYFWRVYAVNEGNTAFLAGSQATATPTPNASLGSGLWSAPATWSTGIVPTGNDAVTITGGTTVTIDTAAAAYSVSVAGTLQFEQTTARTLTVGTNVTVQGGGTLQSNPAGTQTGHTLSIAGNLTNNGTLDFSTNADTAGAILSFTGTSNATFSGTGATNDIRQITVTKGTTPAAILEITTSSFTVRGVTTDTVVGGWLVMANGTLKISGTFTGTSRVFATAAYTIPVSFGFWLNNPNYTVAGQAGTATNNGLLRISQGTFNVGTATGNAMGFSTGSTTIVEGGAVNATSRFGVAAAGNTITYAQTAGTITVNTIGNASATLGSFDLGTGVGSSITMSGGTIVTQINATAIDYRNQAGGGIASVTGGTLQLGNAASGAAKTFNLRGVLPNVVVTNTSAGHTATMSTTLVNFNNIGLNITVNAGATFNTGNVLFLMAGTTLTNNGTLTAGGANSNLIWFDNGLGAQTYTGSGVTTAPLTSMSFQNIGNVTFTSTNQVIVTRTNFFAGGTVNSNKITLGNGGATTAVVQLGVTGPTQPVTGFDVPPVFNAGTGGVVLIYAPELTVRTTGNEMPPSRTLNTVVFTNPSGVTIAGGDVTVNGAGAGALRLGDPSAVPPTPGGPVVTGANTLYFNSAAGTVTRTNGYVDGNFRKSFTAAASKTFEVGTANGYTPVTFNVTAGTFPADVTVDAIQTSDPSLPPGTKTLTRYWQLTATGITADVTFTYLDPADIPGTVTEANLHVFRHDPPVFTDLGGTIDTTNNTATVTGVTSFSDWALAEVGADLSITKTDGVTAATPGGSVTYTIVTFNAGPSANPAAVVADTFPASLTCTWTCAGTGGGTCTASGSGNINDSANLPANGGATYTASCAISPSATGSLSNTATISGGAVPDNNPANNSATDTDALGASADLAITKTDGVTTATAGGSVTYTITASNAGPSNATGATVADTFPASLTCTWTCVGAGGGTCTASGS
ncbi:MAG TPA: fibronectin type III domain-containing protein, partial [Thermoanaerobaculia bacterium]